MDYAVIAEHFNTIHEMLPSIYRDAGRFVDYCKAALQVSPKSTDFEKDFQTIIGCH